jgi:hypothetical protein
MASPTQLSANHRAPSPVPVVLIHSAPERFACVAGMCHKAGVPIVTVRHIAEMERWPVGQIVVTDLDRVTPFWTTVGAAHVLAVVEHAAEGPAALERGATGWLLIEHSAVAVLAFAGVASIQSDSAA